MLIPVLTAGALVGGYFVFRWRENAGHHPVYGDVATWLTFVAAAVGIPFAVYQFTLQRRQLAEQAKTLTEEFARQKKRDELLDAQLEQVQATNRVLVRQQAEKVDLVFERWEAGTDEVDEYGDPAPGELFHVAVVNNGSPRPIRDVRCRIKKNPSALSDPATRVGTFPWIYKTPPGHGDCVALMRPASTYGFVFGTKVSDAPDAVMYVTFTDDAGTRWRIDHNLHLQQDSDVGAFS